MLEALENIAFYILSMLSNKHNIGYRQRNQIKVNYNV